MISDKTLCELHDLTGSKTSLTAPLNADQQGRQIRAKSQRLASIRAELRPVSTMVGHKIVQTMAHNTRLPSLEPPLAVSTC